MNENQVKWLEDIIIACLITQPNILSSKDGRSLSFTIEERKERVLLDYIDRYQLNSNLYYDQQNHQCEIRPSIMLERILKEWLMNDLVTYLNPKHLRINTYLLWISLFGMKARNGVMLQTTLGIEQQYTLSVLFKEQFQIDLLQGGYFRIIPFSPILFKAIQLNRSIEEIMELSYMLPNKEKDSIKLLISEWEDERANYAY
ncbi:hypothetical protein [Cytobacillus purgationiresistens]|uniref:DUF4194 domain-containing protein n=1 Tax=Cytobacillus purgationiresistens TaxID=863449 RepID=A0ABU0AQF4_9BACI|nr:hypothetical protein [Cytobacillus purgationiresistens]MDQ0273511.1 hypothetical protein [Cytobacillus purgationiresistens]